MFVGDSKCGKSTLISRFLDIQTHDDMQETMSLKYMHGTKTNKDNEKVNCNFYELGGGKTFANLLEAALVSSGSILETTVCICLDLDNPGNVLDNLLFWLKEVR